MNPLKYTIIKNEEQYNEYCHILENLVIQDTEEIMNEIDLPTLIIERWDSEHNALNELDPIELIKALMEENNIRAKDLVEILSLSKGTVSKILNYQKGLSKGTIRKLAQYFRITQEALNRSYVLIDQNRKVLKPNML